MILQKKSLSLIYAVIVTAIASSLESEGENIPDNNEPVCQTEFCRDTAEEIIAGMKTDVNPCDDFHRYACGNWGKNLTDKKTLTTYITIISNKTRHRLRDILESNWTDDENIAVKKAQQFYRACMNTSQIEARGIVGLTKLINGEGGWPLTMPDDEWDALKLNSSFSWQNLDARISGIVGNSPIFNIQILPDILNTSSHIIQLGASRASVKVPASLVPDSSLPFVDTISVTKYRNVISKVAKIIAEQRGTIISDDRIETDVREMITFERKLDQISKFEQNVTDYNFLSIYSRVTIDELQEKYDSMISRSASTAKINWLEYIENCLPNIPKGLIKGSTVVAVKPFQYFIRLAKVLDETSPRVIFNLIHWWFVRELMVYTNKEMVDLSKEVNAWKTEPRWIFCVTVNELKHAIAQVYVRKHFSIQTKISAENMVTQIIQEMKKHIESSSWMDSSSKQSALEKLSEMKQFIGFPEFYSDDNLTFHYYDEIKVGDNFLENHVAALKFYLDKNSQLFNTPVNKKKWTTFATDVNAFHGYTENSLMIPAAIIEAPYFSPQQPDAVNYGGIGSVIGHEISHGFDVFGRQYDKDGNLKNWWTNNTLTEYKKRAWCFIQKFSNYGVQSKNTTYKLDPTKTLSENIADSTGIRAVFKAFRRRSLSSGSNMRLPGLENLNTRQLFFLSYAHSLCEMMPLKKMVNMLVSDAHSPAAFRIMGTLSNMKEFADTYQCSPDTRMNLEKKCGIWY